MVNSLRPFLMFQDGAAAAAIHFYVDLIPGAKVIEIERYSEAEPVLEGGVKRALVSLAGQELMVFDSPVKHDFTFTPAISFFLECESEAEIERLSASLLEGRPALMPLGEYGFSRQFCWVADRFGVSWQLNLA